MGRVVVTQRRWGNGLAAGEAAELLAAASVQFWRAPELTAVLAGKVASTTEVGSAVVLAEGLRAAAEGVQHGGLDAALEGVRLADAANERELEAVLRIELAGVARTVGLPKIGLAILRPALVAGHSSGVLGVALSAAVATLAPWRWRDELATVLTNAERLCVLDDRLGAESSTLARADVLATAAAAARAGGDTAAAAGFARQGLRALEDATAAVASGTGRMARLRLELLLALPATGGDGAERAQLVRAATRGVFEPVRAPAAASTAWLAHAVATRIAPEEGVRAPGALLAEAMHIAERHQAYDVLAAAARELAVLQEQAGAAGAGRSVRTADFAAAQQRRRTATIRERLVRAYPGERPRSTDDDAPFAEELDGAATEWADIADADRVIDELVTFAVEVGGFASPSVTATPDGVAPEASETRAPSSQPAPGTSQEPLEGAKNGSGFDVADVLGMTTAMTPDQRDSRSEEQGAGSDGDTASREREPGPAACSSADLDTATADPGEETEETPIGLAHVAGLVVAEGTGGRRRAPEIAAQPGQDTPAEPGPGIAAAGAAPEQEPGSQAAEPARAATDLPATEAEFMATTSEPDPGDGEAVQAQPDDTEPESGDAEEASSDTALGFVDLLAQAMDAYHHRADRADQHQQEGPGRQEPWGDGSSGEPSAPAGLGAAWSSTGERADGSNGTDPASKNELPATKNELPATNDVREPARSETRNAAGEVAQDSTHATVTELGAFAGSDDRFDGRRIPRHRKPDTVSNGSGLSSSGSRNGSKHGMAGRQSWYAEQLAADRWNPADSAD